MRVVIDEEDCIRALREAAKELGETPSKHQYEALGKRPAANSILRVMGGWNAAKEAAELDLIEPGERGGRSVEPKPDGVDIPEDQKWEEMAAPQRWYYKNQGHRISVKEDRRKELRRWFYELKEARFQCEKCGEESPPCLDFHHLGGKLKDVSAMVNQGYSKGRILEEIGKCSVLCANCHQIEHNAPAFFERSGANPRGRAGGSQGTSTPDDFEDIDRKERKRVELQRQIFEYKAMGGGCERCGETNPVCLEFHHLDESEKKYSVGRLISNTPSIETVMNEVEKCQLLCRNCHRQVHFVEPDAS